MDLIANAPLWTALAAGAVAAAIMAAVRGIRTASKPSGTVSPDARADAFDLMAASVTVVLLLGALLYTAAASTGISPGSAAGIRLRNMSPAALAIPLLVLLGARLARTGSTREQLLGPAGQWLVGLIAVTIVVTAMTGTLRQRRQFILQHERRIAATEERLARVTPASGRLAFWTESAQDYLGPASFHFWGNYRYANHAFDQELLSWFPRLTFLRLRNLPEAGAANAPVEAAPARSRYGQLGDWYWRVRHAVFADRPHYTSFPGLVAGRGAAPTVRAIALPADQLTELAGTSDSQRLGELTSRFGPATVRVEKIGGVPWIMIELAPAAAAGAGDRATGPW
jgi:hypothetical protein